MVTNVVFGRSAGLVAVLTVATAMLGCNAEPASAEPGQTRGQPLVLAQAAPAPIELPPDASLTCVLAARERLLLLDTRAIELCTGASSSGPVNCFEAAESQTRLIDPQIIELCRCADSVEPAACFEHGQANSFLTDEQLIGLCSPITTQRLLQNCAPITPVAPAPP